MPLPFMVSDLAGTSVAMLLFTAILFAPGYVLSQALNLFDFRRRALLARTVIALPVSVGTAPIAAYLLAHYWPIAAAPFFVACGMAFVALMLHERHGVFSASNTRSAWRRGWPFIALVAGWMALSVLVLVDLQIGRRLYFPSVTYDYSLRAAIVSAIGRTGVPPRSPFFYADGFYALRYHYFWYILCSIVQQLGGALVTPRQAMLAGTAWCGAALATLVALCGRFLSPADRPWPDRRILIAIGLLSVTGLDIVPVLALEGLWHGFLPSIEWWNEPVMSWVNAALWVPHHVAGLIACMTGLLLILYKRGRVATAILAGTMFAGALGLTIYVTMTFAVCLAVWMVVSSLCKEWKQPALLAISGVTALVVSIPYLGELTAKDAGGTGSIPLQLAVRPLRLVDVALGLANPLDWRADMANLALLPLNYTLELGFFLIVGLVCGRRMWRKRASLSTPELCAFTIGLTSLIVCTLVRSSVIDINDLGMRGLMIAQLILLIWGAGFLEEWPGRRLFKAAVTASLLLGLTGSIYEIAKVRLYPLLTDITSTRVLNPWLSNDHHLGERTYALRAIYEQLKMVTPANAIFEHNPDVEPENAFYGMYADRQVAAETLDCAVTFGGDAARCPARIAAIKDLFSNASAPIDEVCSRLAISVLVVADTDKVWSDRASWVWTRKPFFANNYARAFVCGVPRPLWANAK